MTVAVHIDVRDMSFVQLRESFDQAMTSHDTAVVTQVLHGLSEAVGSTVSSRDAGEISELRGNVARLRRRIARRAADDTSASDIVMALEILGPALDSGLTAALMHDAAEKRSAAGAVLRDRILQELRSGPMRPRDLATRLDTGPSQISRCLKSLQDDRLVEPAPTRSGSDRRAVEYQLLAAPAAA